MLESYVPILITLLVSAGFVALMLFLSIVLGPKRYSEIKDEPFECGTIATGDASERLSVKFYLVAMIFILFDIEVVYMYPWALQLKGLGWYGFWAMSGFIMVLVVGLAYVWRRGVIDWS